MSNKKTKRGPNPYFDYAPVEEQRRGLEVYSTRMVEYLRGASYKQALVAYKAIIEALEGRVIDWETIGRIGRDNRFFLLTVILRRGDLYHPWLYDRCQEVEASTEGHIDLWAREHYKSSIITFGGAFQEIIKNPEVTIGIFSHSKKIANDFVFQIKHECEINQQLYLCYPDIFWMKPEKEAPSWSIANGLIVKRKGNPRECTVEGWGLVDGQPIGKHFGLIIYDDVVTEESVNTADMILKTTKMWELSLSLTKADAESGTDRKWLIGTRYNMADTYGHILKNDMARPRIYPATDDGTFDGKPVLFTNERWEEIKKRSDFIVATQYLQNPVAGTQQEFLIDWIRRWEVRPETLNVYILVDPAGNEKKNNNCNSAFAVIGVDANWNKYLLDGACHKMGLSERWDMLKALRNKWLLQPGVQIVQVGYERFGMQADIEHFKEMMKIERNHFPIEELSWPREGSPAKDARIRRLIPDHKNWRFFYPYDGEETKEQTKAIRMGKPYLVSKPIKRKNHENMVYDLVKWFLTNEYSFFPATTLKDFLDAMSRIYDMEICTPQIFKDEELLPEYAGDF